MVAPARPAPTPCSAAELVALGRERGLAAVGVAVADPLERARRALADRVARGFDGGMAFTYRNPDRSTDPGRAVANARSIVVGAADYRLDPPDEPAPGGPCAEVARYAWLDHYAPLRAALWDIAHHLRARGWKAVAYADDNSIVDREVAWAAGLGWYGKNANLLLPGAGSWFVLGCVITDAPLDPSPAPVADGCGPCRRCLTGCPTGAIPEPGVIDANRCLAWLLQRPGVFPREFRVALGARLYGCDECQEVCPPNHRLGPARRAPAGAVHRVPVLDVLAATDAELLERHGRWYLHDREVRWLRRNALVVLGNTGSGNDPDVVAQLRRSLADPDPILRAHAVWAADRLGRADLLPTDDADDLVRDELRAAGALR